jgi:insertion element IS1 protein InsB
MNKCPHCWSVKLVKNGKSWHGKQNYKCRSCKRQSVERQLAAGLERESLLKRLLLERLSLRAIARVLQVSLGWLVVRVKQLWQQVPPALPMGKLEQAELVLYCLEADEMWSYVGAKDCPQWLWLAIERNSGLVVGFHIGARDEESALGLWLSIPVALRTHALVFTDDCPAYAAVFQKGQHQAEGKKQTTRIERLNNTLRQRCSRLVRKTLSFSKSWQNHFLAIRFFLTNYNFEKLASNPSLI